MIDQTLKTGRESELGLFRYTKVLYFRPARREKKKRIKEMTSRFMDVMLTYFALIPERGSVTGIITIFEQNKVTIPLFICTIILKHQEKGIHQVLKNEQVMIWSSPF